MGVAERVASERGESVSLSIAPLEHASACYDARLDALRTTRFAVHHPAHNLLHHFAHCFARHIARTFCSRFGSAGIGDGRDVR